MRKLRWLFGKPDIAKPVSIASRPAGSPSRPAASPSRPTPSRWSAVSVIPGAGGSCAAVHGLVNRRYLSADAPRLPVPECDAGHCECRYRHHADRRAKVQRKRDREGISQPLKGIERRSISRGRRESDY